MKDSVLHPSGGVEITVKQAPPPPPPLVRASDVGVSPGRLLGFGSATRLPFHEPPV